MKTESSGRCKKCGHLLFVEDGKVEPKQGNHGMYCAAENQRYFNKFNNC